MSKFWLWLLPAWLVSGIVGSAMILTLAWPHDITVGTLLFASAMSLLGPFNLFTGVVFVAVKMGAPILATVVWAAA